MAIKKIKPDDLKIGMTVLYYSNHPLDTSSIKLRTKSDVNIFAKKRGISLYDITNHGFKRGDMCYLTEEGWDYICNPNSQYYMSSGYLDVAYKVVNVDDRNVQVTLENDLSWWVPMYIVSKELSTSELPEVNQEEVLSKYNLGTPETVDVDAIYEAETFADLGLTEVEVLHKLLSVNAYAQRLYDLIEKKYIQSKYSDKYSFLKEQKTKIDNWGEWEKNNEEPREELQEEIKVAPGWRAVSGDLTKDDVDKMMDDVYFKKAREYYDTIMTDTEYVYRKPVYLAATDPFDSEQPEDMPDEL